MSASAKDMIWASGGVGVVEYHDEGGVRSQICFEESSGGAPKQNDHPDAAVPIARGHFRNTSCTNGAESDEEGGDADQLVEQWDGAENDAKAESLDLGGSYSIDRSATYSQDRSTSPSLSHLAQLERALISTWRRWNDEVLTALAEEKEKMLFLHVHEQRLNRLQAAAQSTQRQLESCLAYHTSLFEQRERLFEADVASFLALKCQMTDTVVPCSGSEGCIAGLNAGASEGTGGIVATLHLLEPTAFYSSGARETTRCVMENAEARQEVPLSSTTASTVASIRDGSRANTSPAEGGTRATTPSPFSEVRSAAQVALISNSRPPPTHRSGVAPAMTSESRSNHRPTHAGQGSGIKEMHSQPLINGYTSDRRGLAATVTDHLSGDRLGFLAKSSAALSLVVVNEGGVFPTLKIRVDPSTYFAGEHRGQSRKQVIDAFMHAFQRVPFTLAYLRGDAALSDTTEVVAFVRREELATTAAAGGESPDDCPQNVSGGVWECADEVCVVSFSRVALDWGRRTAAGGPIESAGKSQHPEEAELNADDHRGSPAHHSSPVASHFHLLRVSCPLTVWGAVPPLDIPVAVVPQPYFLSCDAILQAGLGSGTASCADSLPRPQSITVACDAHIHSLETITSVVFSVLMGGPPTSPRPISGQETGSHNPEHLVLLCRQMVGRETLASQSCRPLGHWLVSAALEVSINDLQGAAGSTNKWVCDSTATPYVLECAVEVHSMPGRPIRTRVPIVGQLGATAAATEPERGAAPPPPLSSASGRCNTCGQCSVAIFSDGVLHYCGPAKDEAASRAPQSPSYHGDLTWFPFHATPVNGGSAFGPAQRLDMGEAWWSQLTDACLHPSKLGSREGSLPCWTLESRTYAGGQLCLLHSPVWGGFLLSLQGQRFHHSSSAATGDADPGEREVLLTVEHSIMPLQAPALPLTTPLMGCYADSVDFVESWEGFCYLHRGTGRLAFYAKCSPFVKSAGPEPDQPAAPIVLCDHSCQCFHTWIHGDEDEGITLIVSVVRSPVGDDSEVYVRVQSLEDSQRVLFQSPLLGAHPPPFAGGVQIYEVDAYTLVLLTPSSIEALCCSPVWKQVLLLSLAPPEGEAQTVGLPLAPKSFVTACPMDTTSAGEAATGSRMVLVLQSDGTILCVQLPGEEVPTRDREMPPASLHRIVGCLPKDSAVSTWPSISLRAQSVFMRCTGGGKLGERMATVVVLSESGDLESAVVQLVL